MTLVCTCLLISLLGTFIALIALTFRLEKLEHKVRRLERLR